MIQLFYSNIVKINYIDSSDSAGYYIALLNTNNRIRIQAMLAKFLKVSPDPFSHVDLQKYIYHMYGEWLTTDEVLDLIHSNLVTCGLVSTKAEDAKQIITPHAKRIKFNGLGVDIVLLKKQNLLQKVRLDVLFTRKASIGILSLGLCALLFCHFWGPKPICASFFLTYFLTCLGCTIHEFGHICACNMINVKITGLGVGVYLSFLRLFVNIDSEIWEQPKSKRILVDIAGVYFQLIFVAFLAILTPLFPSLKSGVYANLSLVILNLCPVFRFDGHWVLIDTLDTSNLWSCYVQHFKYCLHERKASKRVVFLTAYFMISTLVTLGIMAKLLPKIVWLPYFFVCLQTEIVRLFGGGYPLQLWPAAFARIFYLLLNIIICTIPYLLAILGAIKYWKHRARKHK